MLSRASITQRLHHPLMAMVLACLLVLDVVYLAAQPTGLGVLLRGEVATQRWRPSAGGSAPWRAAWYVLLDGNRHTLIDTERDGPSRAIGFAQTRRYDVLEVVAASPMVYHAWAPVFEVPQVRVARMDGSPLDHANRDIAIQLVADRIHVRADEAEYLATLPPLGCGDFDRGESGKRLGSLAREVRSSVGGMPRVLWWGVLHNVAGLVVLMLLGVSLAGLPRWIRLHQIGASECRECGYDLRGSDGAKCPECGRGR